MSAFYPNSSAHLDVLSTPYVQDQKFTSYSDAPIIHHGNMMMYLHGAPSDIPFSEINPGASMSTNNLSLSLSSHLSTAIPPPASYEQFTNPGISHVSKVDDAFQNSMRFEASNNLQARMCNVRQYQQAGGAGVVMKSRFLKATQQLLDEVVTVQDAFKKQESRKDQRMKKADDVATYSNDNSMAASGVNESPSVQCKELSGTERQDLQNKLDKLLAMLDEVHGFPAFHQNKQSYMAYGTEETCTSQGIGYIGGESSFVGTNDFAPINHSSYSPSHSRYLRPAQSLLEETANLHGNSLELSDLRRMFFSGSRGATSSELKTELLILCSSSANKHELQTKISELIALLEQAENKYDEYCNRMQEAVSSFEVIAGEGSAKNYTALALEAMCKHFSSLREAILAQIKVAMKKLCSELPHMRTGLSNLSLFDRETRQKRLNIQQLGSIQQCQRQTWRPIRGLPENSVAILRGWLFEHFLHPYPNDPEKLMLASQTGLTKNQVSNWFINARVRFWKPMIEEMYAEEFGESSSPGDSDPLFSSSCGSTREVQFDHAINQ